jgi:hypothetical protein
MICMNTFAATHARVSAYLEALGPDQQFDKRGLRLRDLIAQASAAAPAYNAAMSALTAELEAIEHERAASEPSKAAEPSRAKGRR